MRQETAYLPDENVNCVVSYRGAHMSRVNYTLGGIEYDIYIDNQEIIFEDGDDE